MKNHEEFRASILEKAKKYEARRKARNKKILESVSLCSFAIVIALTVYLGIIPSLPENIEKESETSSVWEEATGFESTEQTELIETTSEFTATTTTAPTEQTTTEPTLQTTSSMTETIQTEITQTETTQIETTEESVETQERPLQFHVDFRGTASNHDFEIGTVEILEITNYKMWETFCSENAGDYPMLQMNGKNFEDMDEAYFEENLLVVIEYAGYDIIQISPCEEDDGKYVLYVTMLENTSNKAKQIQIISVSKDAYLNTNFIF